MTIDADTAGERRTMSLRLPKFAIAEIARAALKRLGKAAVAVVTPAIFIFVLLAIWQVACMGKGSPLPPPTKVIASTWDLIIHPFYDHGTSDIGLGWRVLVSLERVGIGFGIASVIGVTLGVLVGSSTIAYRGLDPVFQVLRTIPPLAWLPIALAALRDNQLSAIFVIAITAVWPIVMNTAVGIRNIPQDYRNVARVLQLNPLEFFLKITLPASVPYMFTGFRIGIGLSWLAIVAAEMMTGGVGIGFFLWDSYNSSLMSEIILALVWIGLVGLILDKLIAAIGRAIGGTGAI
jgi:nitrate/nitrite transport system permease protein